VCSFWLSKFRYFTWCRGDSSDTPLQSPFDSGKNNDFGSAGVDLETQEPQSVESEFHSGCVFESRNNFPT
jgi:hypothetical protein